MAYFKIKDVSGIRFHQKEVRKAEMSRNGNELKKDYKRLAEAYKRLEAESRRRNKSRKMAYDRIYIRMSYFKKQYLKQRYVVTMKTLLIAGYELGMSVSNIHDATVLLFAMNNNVFSKYSFTDAFYTKITMAQRDRIGASIKRLAAKGMIVMVGKSKGRNRYMINDKGMKEAMRINDILVKYKIDAKA